MMTLFHRYCSAAWPGFLLPVLIVFASEGFAGEKWPPPVMDDQVFSSLFIGQLEYRRNKGPDTFIWEDVEGWIGGDYNRLVVKTEGQARTAGTSGGQVQGQALFSRLIAPFWDFQAGVRHDRLYGGPDRSRTFAVIGLEGLAPYWFHVEPFLFISDRGDISASLEATYELLLTQRLIAQPRFEMNVAAQDVEKFGVGSGVNDIEFDLRVRYEIRREFAPYVGISWTRKLGKTADLARREGEEVDNLAIVAGLRLWF